MQSVKLKSELQTISRAISSASCGGLTEWWRGWGGENRRERQQALTKIWKPRHHMKKAESDSA